MSCCYGRKSNGGNESCKTPTQCSPRQCAPRKCSPRQYVSEDSDLNGSCDVMRKKDWSLMSGVGVLENSEGWETFSGDEAQCSAEEEDECDSEGWETLSEGEDAALDNCAVRKSPAQCSVEEEDEDESEGWETFSGEECSNNEMANESSLVIRRKDRSAISGVGLLGDTISESRRVPPGVPFQLPYREGGRRNRRNRVIAENNIADPEKYQFVHCLQSSSSSSSSDDQSCDYYSARDATFNSAVDTTAYHTAYDFHDLNNPNSRFDISLSNESAFAENFPRIWHSTPLKEKNFCQVEDQEENQMEGVSEEDWESCGSNESSQPDFENLPQCSGLQSNKIGKANQSCGLSDGSLPDFDNFAQCSGLQNNLSGKNCSFNPSFFATNFAPVCRPFRKPLVSVNSSYSIHNSWQNESRGASLKSSFNSTPLYSRYPNFSVKSNFNWSQTPQWEYIYGALSLADDSGAQSWRPANSILMDGYAPHSFHQFNVPKRRKPCPLNLFSKHQRTI